MNSVDMRKLWLLFAQTTTVALGVLFILALFKPDLVRWQPQPQSLTIQQAQRASVGTGAAGESFAPAAQKVIPSVVNVYTQQKVRSVLCYGGQRDPGLAVRPDLARPRTAFDIAGTCVADPRSMEEAVRLAAVFSAPGS